MPLTKNQVEAVRYQVKKLGANASNEEIRRFSTMLNSFDAIAVAQIIVDSRTSEIQISNSVGEIIDTQPDDNFDDGHTTPPESPTALTIAQKQSLVTQQVVALDKVALKEDVAVIVADLNESSDSDAMFLKNVKSAVLAYFEHNDNQFQASVSNTLREIQQAVGDSKNFRSRTVEKAITNIKQEVLASGRDWKSQRDEVESELLQILTHPSVG